MDQEPLRLGLGVDLAGEGIGLEIRDGHGENGDVDRPFGQHLTERRRVFRDGSGAERHECRRSRERDHSARGRPAARVRPRGRPSRDRTATRATNGKAAVGAWTCQTSDPRARQASVIAAENRPVDVFVITRTSSIGAIVPPPVTTTLIPRPSRSPVSALHAHARAASLAECSEPRGERRRLTDRPTVPGPRPAMTTIAPHDPIARELFEEFRRWPIFDPHSHIDPHRPAARNLDEVLGYHYYTELAHSAGMPADRVSSDAHAALASTISPRTSTASITPFSIPGCSKSPRNFTGSPPTESLRPISAIFMTAPRNQKAEMTGIAVWSKTQLEAVFLTNEFDDPLDGWDTTRYVPCLRTDDLVLKLHEPSTVARLKAVSGVDVGDFATLRQAVGVVFERFVAKGARACAISLPPGFRPAAATPKKAVTPIRRSLARPGLAAGRARRNPPRRFLDAG